MLASMSTAAIDRLVDRVVSEGILQREEILVHHSKQDDMLRQELKYVKYLWVGYPLVCYSPTVESGVDFSEEHFHKMYIYVCRQSTSHFGLWQMSGRVRKLGSSTVVCCADRSIGLTESAAAFGFSTRDRMRHIQWTENKVRAYLKSTRVEQQNLIIDVPVESALLAVIAANDAMYLNSQAAFYRAFKTLAEAEGHIVTRSQECIVEFNKVASRSSKAKHLIEDTDMTYKEFLEVYGKVVNRQATEEEHWAVYKHQYKLSWGIDLVSEQFVTDNGSELAGSDMQVMSQLLYASDYQEDGLPLRAAYLVKAELIFEVLSCLGFKHPFDVEHKVPQEQLLVLQGKTNVSRLMSTKVFADYNNNITLFSDRAVTAKDWTKLRNVTDTLKLLLKAAAITFTPTGSRQIQTDGKRVRQTVFGLDKEETERIAELVRLRMGHRGKSASESCSSSEALEYLRSLKMKHYGDLITTDWFYIHCNDHMMIV